MPASTMMPPSAFRMTTSPSTVAISCSSVAPATSPQSAATRVRSSVPGLVRLTNTAVISGILAPSVVRTQGSAASTPGFAAGC